MVILAIGFLGVIALALVLTNNNAAAGKINTTTAILRRRKSVSLIALGQAEYCKIFRK